MVLKEGDKIRIKDEVSSETHRKMPPYFTESMDRLKDEVLTISCTTPKGNIKAKEVPWVLHPSWVEPVKSATEFSFKAIPEDGSFEDLLDLIFGVTSTPASEVASILEEAQEILGGERESDYGDPVANFTRIARIASSILNEDISPEQCVVVMMAVKLSREQYKHKRDNLVDLVAYTEILNRVRELNK